MDAARPRQQAPPMGYTMEEIPRFVTYTSPVMDNGAYGGGVPLPLNLIALIVSYLDDIGDIARVTRTSRLLYYMTLPQLYQRVALHSYREIKYVDGRPEGFGSGSPFMLALNGLVTKNHATVVQDFRLWGEWQEVGVEDFARGRVPDNSMMLNILLRACVDKMVKLQRFAWELDCKPLKTLYQGLAAKNTLTSLTLKFPSSRLPRPSVVIPPMPELLKFRAIDIDPLCYPDDISLLFLGSKKLEDVRLHFSPRMRKQAEPTLNFGTYWGRCHKAKYMPKWKSISMQNWFGPNASDAGGFAATFDTSSNASMHFLDCFGGVQGGSANVYVDDTWKAIPKGMEEWTPNFKTIRFNEFASQHVQMMRMSHGAEHIYIVNDRPGKTSFSAATTPDSNGNLITPVVSPGTAAANADVIAAIGHDYIHAFTRHHGSTLKHLLLSDQWSLTTDEISDLVRFCPNLEQLGIALGPSNILTLRLLLPFLKKLHSVRVLDNDFLRENERGLTSERRMEIFRRDLAKVGAQGLRWIGVGDYVYRIGREYAHVNADGSVEQMREVWEGTAEDVKHIEIWRMDVLDIMVD